MSRTLSPDFKSRFIPVRIIQPYTQSKEDTLRVCESKELERMTLHVWGKNKKEVKTVTQGHSPNTV